MLQLNIHPGSVLIVVLQRSRISPLVLFHNLLFFLRGKVVLNIQVLLHLLSRHAHEVLRDGLDAVLEEGLDVHVVGGAGDLEEVVGLQVEELGVPLRNVARVAGGERGLGLLLLGRVMLAPVHDAPESVAVDLGERDAILLLRIGEVVGQVHKELAKGLGFRADEDLDGIVANKSES